MVPWLTEMVTGATGEMSSPPNAGDALTAATGGGATVVDGELDELLLEDSDPDGCRRSVRRPGSPAGGLATPRPDDEPEQAAVAARTPSRRSLRWRPDGPSSNGETSSGPPENLAGLGPVGDRFVCDVVETRGDGRTLTSDHRAACDRTAPHAVIRQPNARCRTPRHHG